LLAARGRRSEAVLALAEAGRLYGEWGAAAKASEIAQREEEVRSGRHTARESWDA
jgi:hypothetical protein